MEDNTPRALSYDEKHAAEAAFSGRPFNPRWSARARLIYDGILNSLPASSRLEGALPSSTAPATESGSTEPGEDRPADRGEALPASIPFQKAIDSGALIDVTPAAKQLGLSFSVTVTKPLWDTGIAPIHTVTSEEQTARLRDVLMAFRLRLAVQPALSPLIDFPALLNFPPHTIPQPFPLLALVQPDEQNQTMVTLLLPSEMATTIIPMN
ncbi:MAG: uncharacterized protein K0S79_421 [Nitrospira sp.]|jgi:hypothetical protein|nr:uncharacterized protein [Nitrospira sp.]